MIRIKSHKRTSPTSNNVLGIGDHIVKIESVTPCFQTDNVDVPWTDRTPQIAIKYVLGGKSITQWVSLKGYVQLEDSSRDSDVFKSHPISGIKYMVIDGRRVEDTTKTKIGYLILANIAYCSGIENDAEIELSDLVGRELLIRVGMFEGQLKVIKTFKRK